MKNIIFLLAFLLLAACNTDPSPNSEESEKKEVPDLDTQLSALELIEQAHQKASFLANDAVQFDLVLSFGGTERVRGTLTLATNGSAGIMVMANGDSLLYNGPIVSHSPNIINSNNARFSAYTWSYFALFPYKLSDPGTRWEPYTLSSLNGTEYNAHKLSFDPGTGDDPNDWYIAYNDPTSHLIQVAAYIVTAGSSVEEAEADPHAIAYSDIKLVDGVPIAHAWTFWEWRKEGGLTEELGNASISNVSFVKTTKGTFQAPEHFITVQQLVL